VSWLLLLHAFNYSLAFHATLLARTPTAQERIMSKSNLLGKISMLQISTQDRRANKGQEKGETQTKISRESKSIYCWLRAHHIYQQDIPLIQPGGTHWPGRLFKLRTCRMKLFWIGCVIACSTAWRRGPVRVEVAADVDGKVT